MTSSSLGVWWWDGTHVADIEGDAGRIRLRYTEHALDTWPANAPLLSCSLPVRTGSQPAGPFFRGVLPEGQHLAVIAANAGLAVTDTMGLLTRYGRDIAGALIVAPDFPGTRPGRVVPYSQEALADEIVGLDDTPLAVHDDSELSIAGLQDKLLLVALEGGGWGRPIDGAPSTHILKIDDRRHPGLVAAEAACMRLARTLGLTTVDVTETAVGGRAGVVVSRFDRMLGSDGSVERIHQEDLCQATGREPRAKYERSDGPPLRDAAKLLDAHAADPLEQLDRLIAQVTFGVLIGNADAHGKNLALLHRGDLIELAPLYDQVPTVLWPNLRRDPAMTIGSRVAGIDAVRAADIVAEAKHWAQDPARARAVVTAVSEQALIAADTSAHEQVRDLVVANANRLLAAEAR